MGACSLSHSIDIQQQEIHRKQIFAYDRVKRSSSEAKVHSLIKSKSIFYLIKN